MNAPSKRDRRRDPPTVERLRADIDSGRTGEKVRYPDPAAAPLGSDEEAAGTPATATEREEEYQDRRSGKAPAREAPGMVLLYALLIGGIALVVLGAFLLLQV